MRKTTKYTLTAEEMKEAVFAYMSKRLEDVESVEIAKKGNWPHTSFEVEVITPYRYYEITMVQLNY